MDKYIQAPLAYKPVDRLNEKLLQYLWQFQYFNKTDLKTSRGENIEILYPGKLNNNQGPDFSEAQIRIDGTLMVGSVEIHLRTSQWMEHGHQDDTNYNNVILHVVFENDREEEFSFPLPILELQSRISNLLIDRYASLMDTQAFIACQNTIANTKDIVWMSWKERLLAERLTRKSAVVFDFLEGNAEHWEEIFWWMLARNFGLKVNVEAFEEMARSIPTRILGRHKNQIHQLEALLMGQAGLLNESFSEDYPLLLQREYKFLQNKYGLHSIKLPIYFHRMRPGNFPTVRLAQLAMLIHNSAHLFSKILDTENVKDLHILFANTANDYWHYHYRFDEPSAFKKKVVGKTMVDNLVINTIVPVVFAYGLHNKEEKFKLKALEWLEQTQAEENNITKGFASIGLHNHTAYESQAYIELKTQYCDHRHCLKCSVGNALLKG
jgi:hypothetical protein